MLFYAKQRARVALIVMLVLIILSNLWASARGIALGDVVNFNLPTLVAVVLGLIFVVSLDSIIYMLNWFVGFHRFLDRFDRAIQPLFARATPGSMIAGGMLAALGEETFFRGILQTEWGLIPAALIFALFHVRRDSNLLAAWAVLNGLVFGWLYQLSGNLLVPMIVHGVHDSWGMFFARYIYKRLLPPAPTLFDWLLQLNQPSKASLLLPAVSVKELQAPMEMRLEVKSESSVKVE